MGEKKWKSKSKRSTLTQVRALHTLLMRAKAKKPYIFVGYSIGGFNARLFAATYPKEVEGIVFVDSSHENQFRGLKGHQLKELKEMFDQIEHSYDVFAGANEIVKARDKDSLRNIPIIVLRAIQKPMDQNDLLSLSRYGKLVVVKDCGHFIQSDKPEIVINAIKELIEKCSVHQSN